MQRILEEITIAARWAAVRRFRLGFLLWRRYWRADFGAHREEYHSSAHLQRIFGLFLSNVIRIPSTGVRRDFPQGAVHLQRRCL